MGSLASVLGEQHPYTLSAQMNLAICEIDPADENDSAGIATARSRLLVVADAVPVVFGPEHPNTLRFEANLALMDLAVGDRSAPERIAALRKRIASRVGEGHPIVEGLDRRHYLYRIIDPHQF